MLKPNINPTIPLKIGFSLVKYTYPESNLILKAIHIYSFKIQT